MDITGSFSLGQDISTWNCVYLKVKPRQPDVLKAKSCDNVSRLSQEDIYDTLLELKALTPDLKGLDVKTDCATPTSVGSLVSTLSLVNYCHEISDVPVISKSLQTDMNNAIDEVIASLTVYCGTAELKDKSKEMFLFLRCK